MSKVINVNALPEFDIEQHLKTDADVAEYLRQVLEEGDSSEQAAAHGHIARARGMNRTPFVFENQDDAPELTESFFNKADLYLEHQVGTHEHAESNIAALKKSSKALDKLL